MIGRLLHIDAQGREIAPSNHAISKTDLEAYYAEHYNWIGARTSVAHFTVVAPAGHTLDTSATLNSVLDVAELVFMNSTVGGRIAVLIPTPKISMFKADEETVDPVAAAALITAIQNNLTSGGGYPLDTFIAGVRRRLMQSR